MSSTDSRVSTFSKTYAEIYDALHESKPYHEEAAFVLSLANKYLERPVSSLIDIACGTGRHLAEFASKGLRIQGNDLSGEMLAQAQKRLEAAGAEDYCLTENFMQEVQPGKGFGQFDIATAFYTALGYLVEPRELDRFFRNLDGILTKDGLFFADFWHGPRMARDFSSSRTKSTTCGDLAIKRTSHVTAVPEKNALHVCFELSTTDQKTAETLTSRESHLVRYHSLPEIENILLAYGYELLEAGPFFDESQSIRDAWNFYICARKGTR